MNGSMRRKVCLAVALAGTVAAPAALSGQDTGCWIRDGSSEEIASRLSPLDSASVALPAGTIKVCYGRPAMRGREIMGGLVPYGQPWRLGANEATTIHMPAAGTIAGVSVDAGWYSLYAIPSSHEAAARRTEPGAWEIFVNREARRWGAPISPEVRAKDVGSGTADAGSTASPVELLTLRLERTSDTGAELVIEWENTLVRVPIELSTGG